MVHLDSHRHHRRAKALDVANLSVKGRHSRHQRREKQLRNQYRRRRANRTTASLRNFRCLMSDACECPVCAGDMPTDRYLHRMEISCSLYLCLGHHDRLGPTKRVARDAVTKTSNFAEWFAMMKSYFPDTVAGRHALDHVLDDLGLMVPCICFGPHRAGNYGRNSKMRVRECTCGAPWSLKQDDLGRRQGEAGLAAGPGADRECTRW